MTIDWLYNCNYRPVCLDTDTVSFNPNGWKIFNRVSKLGVVLKDSILATEDWGIPQIAASFPLADSKCLTLFNHSSYNGGKIFSFFDINFAFRVNCLYMAFVIVPGFHAFSASFLDK